MSKNKNRQNSYSQVNENTEDALVVTETVEEETTPVTTVEPEVIEEAIIETKQEPTKPLTAGDKIEDIINNGTDSDVVYFTKLLREYGNNIRKLGKNDDKLGISYNYHLYQQIKRVLSKDYISAKKFIDSIVLHFIDNATGTFKDIKMVKYNEGWPTKTSLPDTIAFNELISVFDSLSNPATREDNKKLISLDNLSCGEIIKNNLKTYFNIK